MYFLLFSTTFWIFFRLGKPKKITICIPTDGNFPIFENSTLSSRRKSDLIFPYIFSRNRCTVTFDLNLTSCHFFSLTRRITTLLVNFSWKKLWSCQAHKSPASLRRKFPSLCFQYVCFSFSPVLQDLSYGNPAPFDQPKQAMV